MIGRYPTPVERISALSTRACELWVKRDDRSGEAYGGNKVRKLEHILAIARARAATRIVTIGAAGSHHVLATTLYGARAGFRVAAVLTPQPRTEHALDDLRASIGLGLDALPVGSIRDVPSALARLLKKGDYVVPPGGSNPSGSRGYLDAVRELVEQIRTGEIPPPDAMVVALGSGGTAAGLAAGVVREGLGAKIVGVRIVEPFLVGPLRTIALAAAAARTDGTPVSAVRIARRLEVDRRWLGAGYGHATEAGERASRRARDQGLSLDPTYTAKAFAAVLDLVESGRFRRVLYWHTLSSAPLAPLLERAPREDELGPSLRSLLR